MNSNNIYLRCDALVIALVGKNLAQHWWDSPNWAFNLLTPAKQFNLDPETVLKYLMRSAND